MIRKLFLFFLLGAATPALAQERDTLGVPKADTTELRAGGAQRVLAGKNCRTGAIASIFVDNHSIFDMSDPGLARRFRWAYRTANKMHIRTRPSVIRRELLFRVGDCYDQIRIEESARLLRAYDFISQADVFGVQQPDGSYHVVVDTQDEWTTQVDMRVAFSDGIDFQGGRFRELNLLGTGQAVSLYYRRAQVVRDYGVTYESPQLFGTRWDGKFAAGRSRAGSVLDEVISHPFVGEIGRHAARESISHEDRLFDFISRDGATRNERQHVLVPMRDATFDIAGVKRLGRRGNLTLFGGGLSFQQRSYPGVVTVVQGHDYDNRTPADSTDVRDVTTQNQPVDAVRAAILLGQRNVWWVKRRGFDSLRGQQDIKLGAEGGISLAGSIPSLSHDDDLFGTVTMYAGMELGPAVITAQLRQDARRDFHAKTPGSEWKDVYGEGEVLAYVKPPIIPRHTLVFRAAGAGGWTTTTPFQLTLGGDRALRGYDPERLPGGRRAVFTAEDRYYFGWPFKEVFDLGGSAFVDVGRIWPGDVPFGVDSGWRASGGFGLRGSFPAGSRNTYRADIAFPLVAGTSLKDVRFILSVGEILGLSTSFGDPQIVRSRQAGVSGELFSFPN